MYVFVCLVSQEDICVCECLLWVSGVGAFLAQV